MDVSTYMALGFIYTHMLVSGTFTYGGRGVLVTNPCTFEIWQHKMVSVRF